MINYELGLNTLKNCLPAEELNQFDSLATSLKENLAREMLFRSTETTRSERSQIIYPLNVLARKYCGKSFDELCESPSAPISNKKDEQARQNRIPHVVPPTITTNLLLPPVMPTAYCYNRLAHDFPFVTIHVDNTAPGCIQATVIASVTIESYGDNGTTATLNIEPQKQYTRFFLPRLTPMALAALNRITPASLHITIEQTIPTSVKIYNQTEDIQLHARNTALLAIAQGNGSLLDLSEHLVAWVTPHHLEVKKLLRKATKYLPRPEFIGYANTASSLAEAAALVREQAQALFEALEKDIDLIYINSSIGQGDEIANQLTQFVRFPSEIIGEGGSANCLDGAVLFASLLESIGIQPLLVLIPGHAIVGWRISRDTDEYEFLDTSMIGVADFQEAQQAARTIYDQALLKRNHMRELFDPNGFARIIDIAACRKKGIRSLE